MTAVSVQYGFCIEQLLIYHIEIRAVGVDQLLLCGTGVGAVEADGIYFTGVIADAFSGKLVVTCSAPVKVNGKLIGVVGIERQRDDAAVHLKGTNL